MRSRYVSQAWRLREGTSRFDTFLATHPSSQPRVNNSITPFAGSMRTRSTRREDPGVPRSIGTSKYCTILTADFSEADEYLKGSSMCSHLYINGNPSQKYRLRRKPSFVGNSTSVLTPNLRGFGAFAALGGMETGRDPRFGMKMHALNNKEMDYTVFTTVEAEAIVIVWRAVL